ncbi:MAG: phospho-N-acetylmuramoyl-pentapeptide-transferase [Planctomycetaceae bacterium]|nr:phospho-N-acetylmuramoyl-pentapeptide-transferase [Planctomycetaceae bacterium]
MLVFLLHRFASVLEQLEPYASGDSRVFLTARIALASLTAFLMSLLIGPMTIRFLAKHCGERIASDSARLNELHAGKSRTPSMGGAFILVSLLCAVLLWGDLGNRYLQGGIILVSGLGIIGGIDDWIKLRTNRKGLTVKQKFVAQCAISAIVCWSITGPLGTVQNGLDFIWPFGNAVIPLGMLFVLWGVFVLTGSSNAVNLADGLDGLASGCLLFSGSALLALCYLAGHKGMAEYLAIPYVPGSGELAVLLGGTVGATLGFLWFNSHPAEVFMGDTGSLPLGGAIGLAGLVTKQEVLLAIIGGVFVVETLSVILQVGWFKMTRRRLIACSPLHNHFVFKGMHETKIVVRFWISSALLAILGLALLKIR